ncbi:MAG TPA: adenylate/guanylate cyclase domain-containing protein [Beijerinckiaceae bacterium]|jgi:adenylate cyclase
MAVNSTRATRPRAGRRLGPAGLLAALVPIVLGAALSLWEPFAVRALRDLTFDAFQRWSPRAYDPASPVRVVAIDDESLERLGQWPWPRAKVAELIEKLTEAGAAAVVLDVLFSEPERTQGGAGSAGDRALAEAVAKGRVVLGMAFAEQGAKPLVKAGFATAGDDPRPFLPRFAGALMPLESLREDAAGLGSMNFIPDRDLVVRELPTVFNVAGELVPSLSAEAMRVAQGASTFVIRASNASGDRTFGEKTGVTSVKIGAVETLTGPNGTIRIRYAGTQAQRRIEAWRILSGEFDPKAVEGAVVLFGATASALYDLRATPLENAVPGIDIHAEMIESVLSGAHLTRPDFMRGLETILVVIGGLFGIAAAARLPPLSGAVVTGVMVAGFIAASAVAFDHLQQLFDPLWPGASTVAAFGIAGVSVLRRTEAERRWIRDAFGHYLSPAVVETLARDPSRLVLGGETRILTVLFSDIRGFTSRSEKLSAEEVVGFLNSIHTPLTQHVLDTGGTLDKFMGDGMMAFWNAPVEVRDHVRAALRAALAMQRTVAAMDERLKAEALGLGQAPGALAIGIGIHTGPACVGNVGSMQRFDYSAIGDTVNAAARIEPLCKAFRVGILVSEAVVAAAPDFAYLYVGAVALRGRESETTLYALHGDEAAATEDFRRFAKRHEEAVRLCLADDPRGFDLLDDCARDPLGALYVGYYRTLEARRAEDLRIVGV